MQKNHKNIFRTELFSKKSYPLSGLESYLGEAASVSRQLTKSHRYAFRVRRSSDNAVMDIGFRNGESDVSTLLNFCNGGSGFVQLLYGCNGSIFANDNSGKEPRIVNSGTLDISNNKPAMVFDGSNDALWCANNVNIDIVNQPLYLNFIAAKTSASAYIICKNSDVSADIQYSLNASLNMAFYLEGATNNIATTSTASFVENIQTLHSATWKNGTMQCYNKGVAEGTTDSYSSSITSRNHLVIGARWNSGGQAVFLNGKLSEFCILKGNPKQTDFETKTKKYYGIV
jgi:hypothetical protein